MYLVSQDLKESIFMSASFPSKFNLSMEWNFGFMVMMVYFFQIITGIVMTFFFKMGFLDCLKSKCFILKEVVLGWAIIYLHTMLPNSIFLLMYLHIFKSLYNPIFIYKFTWVSGFIIFFFFSVISFTGYSLVAGCLGFWAMIVFMNMVEFLLGESLSFMLFSDFGSLSDLILFKVFTYHFLLSVGILIFIFIHFYFMHLVGSSLGIYSKFMDFFSFLEASFMKDFLLSVMTNFIITYFLGIELEKGFFSMDNFLELNPFKVPDEMNSEWYLSEIFMILSCSDSKFLGMFLVFFSFLIFSIKFLFKGKESESMVGKIGMYSIIGIELLLIVFTFGKYNGSFYITSILLSFFLIFFDYTLLNMGSKKFIFDFIII